MDLADATTRFERQLRADGRSPHTISSYLRDLRTFAGWLESSGQPAEPDRLTPDHVSAFVTSRVVTWKGDGTPKAPGSVDKVKMSLKAFFSFLVADGALSTSPARLLKGRNGKERIPPEILTKQERRTLLRTVERTRGDKARRDLVVLEVPLLIGLRLDSLASLDVEDVRLAEKRLLVRRLKGGGETQKFLPARLRERLTTYLRWRGRIDAESPALFLSNRGTRLSARQIERIVPEWAARAGIEKPITVHTLRHCFATELYGKCRDLLVVQRALDHKQVTTTQIYAQVSDRDLESALESL